MRDVVAGFIQRNNLFREEDKLLLAVSGGADSIALCHLLHTMNYNFIIAHCNFCLRGEESEGDEMFVKAFGSKLGRKVVVKRFDPEGVAKRKGLSIQMSARELRYDWFEDLRATMSCNWIVTAHHQDDNIETILLNLTRGTGLAGLHGIPLKNSKIVRPLLTVDKQEILNYLQENQLLYREDSSNSSDKYHRNLLRHHVVPQLKKINPNLTETILDFITKIAQAEEIVAEEHAKFVRQSVQFKNEQIFISIEKLITQPGPLLKLFEVLKPYGFNFDQATDLYKNMEAQSGKIYLSKEYQAIKDRESIIVAPLAVSNIGEHPLVRTQGKLTILNFAVSYYTLPKETFDKNSDPNIAQLDLEKLKFPLSIRPWRAGDYFFPLGMNKKKKLSDFFIDRKIPLSEKRHKLVLLSSSGDIAWVIGERIDDRFKITAETSTIFFLKVETGKSNQ